MQLPEVVPPAPESVDLGFAHVGDQLLDLRIAAEEVFDVVGAVVGAERLVLAVDRAAERAQEDVLRVAREEGVPLAAPQHLDHAPAGAAEKRFEFLDDLAVATHRPIEALQVAIDDERDVVELFARRQRQSGNGLRLVHLAVAEDAPDVPVGRPGQAARLQVAHESRLVDRVQGPEAHRAGRKLPEIRHQPRMRIAAKPLAADFLAVVGQPLFAQAPFEESPRVDARRGMRLEVDEIAALPVGAAAKEVVEPDFEDLRRRGVAGDVSAELAVRLVRAHDHRQRVPSHDRRETLLDGEIARIRALVLDRHGIAIGGKRLLVRRDADLLRTGEQPLDQEQGARRPGGGDDRLERLDPFIGLQRIGVRRRRAKVIAAHDATCSRSGDCSGSSGQIGRRICA